MRLFKKKAVETKCKVCGMELNDPVRFERHMKKAHGRPSQKNFDNPGTNSGCMW